MVYNPLSEVADLFSFDFLKARDEVGVDLERSLQTHERSLQAID